MVLPTQVHLCFFWPGNGKLLLGSHTFLLSLSSCNRMDSSLLQEWSCDSILANQRVHPSSHDSWLRSGHVTTPESTKQNIGTNTTNYLREKYVPSSARFETRKTSAGMQCQADALFENKNNMESNRAERWREASC